MNKKAEAFQAYLAERAMDCFTVEEVEGDQLHTVVFRSRIDVEGQQLPTLVLLDSSVYTIIRVKIGISLINKNNETLLLQQINRLNSQYKIFKYYFDEEGSLFLDTHVVSVQGELDCQALCTVLQVLIQHLNSEYKHLMQLVWA